MLHTSWMWVHTRGSGMSDTDTIHDGDDRLYYYQARVLRVVDGDTLDLMVDLGFSTYRKIRCRLHGLDTPEVYGVKKDSLEYQAGKRASDFVRAWVAAQGAVVLIRSAKGSRLVKADDKYGRYVVIVHGDDPKTLNEVLVEKGLAEAKDYG